LKSGSEIFSGEDREVLFTRGMTIENAEEQLAILRDPPAAVVLVRPCTVGDGIERLDDVQQAESLRSGEAAAREGRVMKFVPASGAATRMFNELRVALESGRIEGKSREFVDRLDHYPFAAELRSRSRSDEPLELIRTALEELGFDAKPKGLIPFHRVGDSIRSAFHEHLLEASKLVRDRDGLVRIHFTVSPENVGAFEEELARVRGEIERLNDCRLEVSFSVQHPSTDTIALDDSGNPFRDREGVLLFRPAGHGALLRNLSELGGDIVTIKNIDNILPDERNAEAIRWKQILAGVLVKIEAEVYSVLRALDAGLPDDALQSAVRLMRRFARRPSPDLGERELAVFIRQALDRPIRVCGVVANEGEPGGAPFWTARQSGESIQIVESSQVDGSDPEQKRIFESSTHFNPVDVVCALRDYRGNPFDLTRFVDRRAVFVSKKSHEGRELRALELPGLWNGAMAEWNTVCVEVPAATFAPVKTVFDLLRPQHRSAED
jgi:hypothetical protein